MTRRIATILVLSLLILAESLYAGQLDSRLRDQVNGLSSGETVKIWITLQDDFDPPAFKQSIVARAATRADRHQLAFRELHEKSRQQEPLLSELARLKTDRRVLSYKGHWIANVIEAEVTVGLLETLAQHPDVALIQAPPVIQLVLAIVPGDKMTPADATSHGSNLDHINAPAAWAAGYTGAGRLVCTFDTGVQGNHPALSSSWKGNDGDSAAAWFDQKDTLNYPHPVVSSSSHGTHTTGIIVGRTASDTIGVAPGAKWISAGVIGLQETSILDAFEWAANPDGDPNTIDDVPDVINHSWYLQNFTSCADAVYTAIENTEALGIVNIISAGNSGALPQTIENPADRAVDALDCFAVGNLNHDTELINSSSSRGPSPCDVTKIKPQVVAPGTSIRSAYIGSAYGELTGTSQAAPHVSGLVLLMRQKNPNATVDEIKSAIMNHTQAVGGSALPNNTYGYGEIDCVAALAAISVEATPAVVLYDFTHPTVAAGDTVVGTVVLKNQGANATNVAATITGSNSALTVVAGNLTFGAINRGDTVRSAQSLRIKIADTASEGSLLPIQMTITGTGFSTPVLLYVRVAEPLERTYVTHDLGNIDFSISNYGVLGLGDNSLFDLSGAGFKFKGGANFLWEGGIIMSAGATRVSDAVHGIYDEPMRDFTVAPGGNMVFMAPGPAAPQQSYCVFNDSRAANPLNIEVTQETFAFNTPNDDHLIIRYILKNIGGSTVTGLRFGLFLDWDPFSYNQNAGGFEASDGFAWICYHSTSYSIYRGVKLIDGTLCTAGSLESYPYDWDDANGFTEDEKHLVLANGFSNANTYSEATTSLFQIMAAGPMTLAPGGMDTVSFALLAGDNFAAIQAAAAKALSVPSDIDDPEAPPTLPTTFTLYQNYPNPFNPATVIAFDLPRRDEYALTIYNTLGQEVERITGEAGPGQAKVTWDASTYASGVYLYRVTVGEYSQTRKMLLLK